MADTVKILSRMNGKALTVSKGQKKTRPGDLLMEAYLGLPEQHFKVVFIGQFFGLQSVSDPTKYIDVPGESTKIYEKIIVYDFNGNINQKWFLLPADQQFYKIQSASSKLVMEIEGGIDAEDVGVVQNKDYNNLSQMWRL
jgi:hypothetical protein